MIGKNEIRKDTLQVVVESAATHAGRIAAVLAGAVRDVAHEVGELASDVFEIREAAGRADVVRRAAHDRQAAEHDTAPAADRAAAPPQRADGAH